MHIEGSLGKQIIVLFQEGQQCLYQVRWQVRPYKHLLVDYYFLLLLCRIGLVF